MDPCANVTLGFVVFLVSTPFVAMFAWILYLFRRGEEG